MIRIGQPFPDYSLTGVVSNDLDKAFKTFDQTADQGRWKVFFFWPKDFTFVCPTEIAAFGRLEREFRDRDAQLYGVSIDSEFVHLAWRKSHEDLRDLPFPMLSDIKRELSTALGVLDPEAGVAQRATFIVDPQGVIQTVEVTAEGIGRDASDLLRKIKAAQYVAAHPGEVCPAKWKEGAKTLAPSLELVGKI
jgi:peroxiredoxin (alkyl hydroperoxide reductase subunit C)